MRRHLAATAAIAPLHCSRPLLQAPFHTTAPSYVSGGNPLVAAQRRKGVSAVTLREMHQLQQQQPHVAAYSSQRSGIPIAATTSSDAVAGRTFWTHAVRPVDAASLKRSHAASRAEDKRHRFTVRRNIRDDGVLSNLYPVEWVDGPSTHVYIYEMYVTRRLQKQRPGEREPPRRANTAAEDDSQTSSEAVSRPRGTRRPPSTLSPHTHSPADDLSSATAAESVGTERTKRVEPRRAWRAIQRSLRQRYADVPPMVQLNERVYTPTPLPAEALRIPSEYHDASWAVCELRFVGRQPYASMSARELQQVVNKTVAWSLRDAATLAAIRADTHEAYAVVRDTTGKSVCTTSGIASGGLRVFKGVVTHAVFVDDTLATQSEEGLPPPPEAAMPALDSTDLADCEAGERPAAEPLTFVVKDYIRHLTYKGKEVDSYSIGDASGTFLASYWCPQMTLAVRRVYRATGGVRVRVYPNRGNMRLFEFTEGETELVDVTPPSTTTPAISAERVAQTSGGTAFPGRLALKIDTKGTIASELSLWQDVRQQFGPGPYDEDMQRRIVRSVQGTPVVCSYSLSQDVVRLVRFNITMGGDGVSMRHMDPGLVPHLPQMEPGQPWAVFANYTVMPLQVLHCCFDPAMRGWQDIAIAVLSLFPEERQQLLQQFRAALGMALRQWGMALAAEPWRTKLLSLLPVPQKTTSKAAGPYAARATLRHPPPPASPSTIVVIGVGGPRCTAEETRRISLTAQQLAASFKTTAVYCAADDADAVKYMADSLVVAVPSSTAMEARGLGAAAVPQQLQQQQQLRDPNTAVILVKGDRDSRSARWLLAECLCRGIVPVAVAPCSSPRRVALLCGNVKRQIAGKWETDPLRGVSLGKEVPVIAGRRVLLVGVDACHTNVLSTGCVVGILFSPQRNHLLPTFWKQEARGREAQHVAAHFRIILAEAAALYDGLDEVVVFQDGDIFSELNGMKDEIAARVPGCGLTFMCLHKRCNVRFIHDAGGGGGGAAETAASASSGPRFSNVVKGVLIPTLTTAMLDCVVACPSFYLQTHESNQSTARAVQYTVHHVSPTLDVTDVQQIANVMANVFAPSATKLPMSTRCAHRLAERAERLMDAVPQFACELLPPTLKQRMWFM